MPEVFSFPKKWGSRGGGGKKEKLQLEAVLNVKETKHYGINPEMMEGASRGFSLKQQRLFS